MGHLRLYHGTKEPKNKSSDVIISLGKTHPYHWKVIYSKNRTMKILNAFLFSTFL